MHYGCDYTRYPHLFLLELSADTRAIVGSLYGHWHKLDGSYIYIYKFVVYDILSELINARCREDKSLFLNALFNIISVFMSNI